MPVSTTGKHYGNFVCLQGKEKKSSGKKKSLVYSSSLTLTHYMIFEQVSSFAKWE
jgi:hypothetical protein